MQRKGIGVTSAGFPPQATASRGDGVKRGATCHIAAAKKDSVFTGCSSS